MLATLRRTTLSIKHPTAILKIPTFSHPTLSIPITLPPGLSQSLLLQFHPFNVSPLPSFPLNLTPFPVMAHDPHQLPHRPTHKPQPPLPPNPLHPQIHHHPILRPLRPPHRLPQTHFYHHQFHRRMAPRRRISPRTKRRDARHAHPGRRHRQKREICTPDGTASSRGGESRVCRTACGDGG